MKIVYLVHQFFPMHYTGTEKVVLNIASMMQKQGHSVKVITYSFYENSFYDKTIGDFFLKEFSFKNISIIAIKHKSYKQNQDINFGYQDDSLSKVSRDIIASENPNIVHAVHLMRMKELILSTISLNIPYIITLTDFWLICPKVILVNSQGDLCSGPGFGKICRNSCAEINNHAITERLKISRQILESAKLITAPSKFVANIIRNEFPGLAIKAIPHGLNYNMLIQKKEIHYNKKIITFCYAGSINPHKGIHVILEAFSKIKQINYLLKIYGTGDDNYLQQIKNKFRCKKIKFLGVFNENEIGNVLSKVDVVIISSIWYETYSLILHEAFACNIPVIASNVGVMAEKIIDNTNGFLFNIGDADHLQQVIEKIINNPEILNNIKKNIHKIYTPTVEQESYVYEKLYQAHGIK
jgi:glycosyltransferase involved in cell wall biosynthesis